MFDQIMCKKGHKNVYYKYAYNEQKVAEESFTKQSISWRLYDEQSDHLILINSTLKLIDHKRKKACTFSNVNLPALGEFHKHNKKLA